MEELILDIEKLHEPCEPVVLIDKDGDHTEEAKEIINKLQEVFDSDKNIVALAAPQIGIKKRIFGLRFDNDIKYFINPIVTKKISQVVAPEYFSSMPGKEILIGRPKEIFAVYYTKELKYEDNKLLDAAARVFDQMSQLLDGITPDNLGLVADLAEDGSFFDLSEEEMQQARDIWKQFVEKKLKSLEEEIRSDEETSKLYDSLRFSESVINGKTQVLEQPNKSKKQYEQLAKNKIRKSQMDAFVRSKK